MPQTLLTEDELRQARKDNAPYRIEGQQLRKAFACEVRAAEGESRAIDFTISTDSVDRMGDTIAVDGWKLEAYRKNPVVLFAHDSSSLPVGKATNVRVENGMLKARAEFAPREISGFADAVYQMLKAGFLSATSVGFLPLKYAFVDDAERRYGIDFLEQELLEFSVVPVPANAEALIEGRAAGIVSSSPALRAWCERLLALPAAPPSPAPPTPLATPRLDLARRQLALTRRRAAF